MDGALCEDRKGKNSGEAGEEDAVVGGNGPYGPFPARRRPRWRNSDFEELESQLQRSWPHLGCLVRE